MDPQTQPTPGAASEGYAKKIFSPKNIILYLVVAAFAYGAIYYFFFARNKSDQVGTEQQPTTQEEAAQQGQAPTGPTPIIVNLSAQNDSGQNGVALLIEENGQVKVAVSVDNPVQGTPQPAHIHIGTCPGVGEVKYPLNDVVSGQSETTINTTLEALKSEPLAINVHKSAQEIAVYTACGDIAS